MIRCRLKYSLIALAVFLFSSVCNANTKSLYVGLHASWPNTRISSESIAWLSDTVGDQAILPFLHTLLEQSADLPALDQNDLQITLRAFNSTFHDSAMRTTLRAVLHSRIYSAHVHMHYSLAQQSLDAISPSMRPTPHVFAIRIDESGTTAWLLNHPDQLSDWTQAPSISAQTSQRLPFALSLVSEIALFDSCPTVIPRLILYADVLSQHLLPWLTAAENRARECAENVFLRFWKLPDANSQRRPSLQGFQVEVALKSTEYKVVDDRVFTTRLFDECGYAGCVGSPPVNHLPSWPQQSDDNGSKTYTGCDVLQYVSVRADGRLDAAINALQSVTEDAPSVVRSEAFQQMSKKTKSTLKVSSAAEKLRTRVQASNLLFINGRSFNIDSLREDFASLFRCLSSISTSSMTLRRKFADIEQEASFSLSGSAQTQNANLRVNLDYENTLKNSLLWINDLRKDSRYARWPSLDIGNEDHVAAYVKMSARKATSNSMDPSQLVKVKSNHLSLLAAIDPGDPEQFMYLSLPESVVYGNLPIQVGLVLIPNGPVSSLAAACFYYFLNNEGRETALQFLGMLRQVVDYMGGSYQLIPLTEQIVDIAFHQISKNHDSDYGSAKDVLNNDEDVKRQLEESHQFAVRYNLLSDIPADDVKRQSGVTQKFSMLIVLNGIIVKDINAEVIPLAMSEQRRISKLLSSNRIVHDEESCQFEQWVSSDSDLIVVNGISQEMRYGNGASSKSKSNDVRRLSTKHLFPLYDELNSVQYIHSAESESEGEPRPITVWLAGKDRDTEEFQWAERILRNVADSSFAERAKARFAVIPPNSKLNKAVVTIGEESSFSRCPCFIINGKIVPADKVQTSEALKVEIGSDLQPSVPVTRSETSGRDAAGQQSTLEDLLLLQRIANNVVSSSCEASIRPRGEHPVDYTDVVDAMTSMNLSGIAFWDNKESGLAWDEGSPISVLAVVDPMHPNAHIISAALRALRTGYDRNELAMGLVIAPTSENLMKHFDLPSTYFKFLMSPDFGLDSLSDIRPPQVPFHLLPQHRVLTVGVKPPRAWFVSSFATNYDMDNVILESLPETSTELHAEYELNNLIVEGSCIDQNEAPPQGLKLILENDSGVSVDTVVMANLGYFQLKVPTPGRWNLFLAAGPSRKIFSLKSMDMYRGGVKTSYRVDGYGRVPILVESLSGAGGILLHVARNPGMENASLQEPQQESQISEQKKGVMNSLVSKFQSLVSGTSKTKSQIQPVETTQQRSDTIHVFSVASGHLYERFLKIMISSVTKHAGRPVKFWLLENYLSPSFKKMLPHFAKEMGCEVGMVTYRWPGWLRAQTEKQRIIWAYKILFLDVLFPLDVNRIIFVDSDQVVRGDLGELMDIDLEGAPYGYVPFCDSRKEVEGYRFWKTGFWKDTLRGAKYRISALYVVDLARFRETEAGDTLRFIYQSLSADPNSLSNLDQDLPNYASVSALGNAKPVPIFDLPQEWLWCESWCDDASKETAKTIDLCNNPMTKEPKLASAKRIVPEWEDYDNAASVLTEQIYNRLAMPEGSSNESMTCSSGQVCPEVEQKPPAVNEEEKAEL